MSDYQHTKTYPLRYSDFDFKDELTAGALLSLVQESACLSADELGFGYDDLRPRRLGFIVVFTYCELVRPVRLGEALTVETWPLPPRHVIFERDYRVKAGEEIVAKLASRWCLVDLNTFSLLQPDALKETHERCPYRAEQTVTADWKIQKLRGEGREVRRMTVGVGHCDHYLHANNARYADFFFDCFTMEELAARRVKSFRIAYVKQAKPGSELVFYRKDFEGYSVCEAECDGLVAQFRVDFEE